ncbi:hypothetical protein [Photobacterium swingsii]|uniref:hypothetical protein n=1 Tax=Photobacterium swingsii TaxID=680026 RepID=UPI004068C128
MAEEIFVHSYSEISDRYAILDDNETVAFLYITKVGMQAPERDALAYMRITPPKEVSLKELIDKGEPPILPSKYASDSAVILSPVESSFSFVWSEDGDAVSLLYGGNAIVFLSVNEPLGFSKAAAQDSPLVKQWDQSKYEQIFQK